MLRTRYQALTNTKRRTFWITLAIAVIFTIFALTLISDFINSSSARARAVNTIPFALALIAFTSTWLILTGRSAIGAWLLQLGVAVALIANVTQSEGLGFPSAVILLAITLYVPVQILNGRNASLAMGIGIILTTSIIALDTFWVGQRISVSADDRLIGTILSIGLALILVSTTVIQFRNYPIRTKILILSLGAGLVSILSVATLIVLYTQQTLTQQTRGALVSAAHHTIDEIDTYIKYNKDTVSADARLPEIVAYLEMSPQEQKESSADIQALLNTLALRDPNHIGSYSIMNKDGLDIADTYIDDIGVDKSTREYFTIPVFSRNIYVSPVLYSPTSPDHAFYIGAPIVAKSGDLLGVLRVRYRASILNEIVISNNGFAGEGSFGILLDENNIIVAHGTNSRWISRTLTYPGDAAYNLFVTENRILKTVNTEEISLQMPDFANKLETLDKDTPYFTSTDETWGTPVEVGVARSSVAIFKLAFVQPQAIALNPVKLLQQTTVAVATITGLLVLLIGFLVSRTITQPLVKLATVAEDISSGNLSSRAQYNINDELGTLAQSFNRMTSQLQDTLGGLERRVAERTADLETSQLLSEQRAQELQSISEISRIISTEQKLDVLLPLITRLVSDRMDYYHVGIFFLDETRRYVYLQASNSEGGQRMLARGHRLEVGTGLVGTVAQTGKPRIALDVGADASFFNNPDLPATHSEMVLPLNVRGTTIGVLDVQSTKPGAFTERDANSLSILADQIAIAIENARLFGRTEQAREEAEALYAQIQRQEWSTFTKQEEKIGYQQTATGGNPISTPVETDEIRKALENGQVVVIEGTQSKNPPAIAVPVKLRGHTIGVLNIKAPSKTRKWNKDEINLAQAVSDRLALALDNVRLLQESQRRAAKEAKIGEVSAKIGASINMRNVLQTAVEELGRALPGSEVVIQFEDTQEN